MKRILLIGLLAACERERRENDAGPEHAKLATAPAGPAMYEENAFAASEGKRLYQWFNCVGCHFQGGGGMGPALMDEAWRYGNAPEQIYDSIVAGRPNGMPAFKGKIPEQQVWQIVAYVRSMAGLLRLDVEQSRGEELSGRPPDFILEHRHKPQPKVEPTPP